MTTALHIPADINKALEVVDLDKDGSTLANLRRLVGGTVDVLAHQECDVWLHDEGRILNLPINPRLNWWTLTGSAAAKEKLVNEYWIVYGDVVLTGPPDAEGDCTSLSREMIDVMMAIEVPEAALKDWDVRSTSIHVTNWDLS